MSEEEVKTLESGLLNAGYVKYTQALSSTETFGYFKSGDVRYSELGEKTIGYQIEYRFWDWRKYGQTGNNAFGVDVIIINSGSKRADLELTSEDLDIDRIERIADNFNEFCKTNKIGNY